MSTENTELKPFNPQDIMQGVRDKIKASFVDLIPEEHWNQLVQNEIDKFFKPVEQYNGYGNRPMTSDFSSLINSCLKDYTQEKIKEYMNGTEFRAIWDSNGNQGISTGIAKILTENSGQIFTQMIGQIFQIKFQEMSYKM